MADWQRMNTAPKDGTAVLALLDGSDIPHPIRWDKDLARWCMTWDGFELTNVNGPRYWMRCPDDPDAHGVRVWDGARGCPNCDVPPGQPHSSTCPRGLTDLLNRCEQCRSNGQTCSGACTPGVPERVKEQGNG